MVFMILSLFILVSSLFSPLILLVSFTSSRQGAAEFNSLFVVFLSTKSRVHFSSLEKLKDKWYPFLCHQNPMNWFLLTVTTASSSHRWLSFNFSTSTWHIPTQVIDKEKQWHASQVWFGLLRESPHRRRDFRAYAFLQEQTAARLGSLLTHTSCACTPGFHCGVPQACLSEVEAARCSAQSLAALFPHSPRAGMRLVISEWEAISLKLLHHFYTKDFFSSTKAFWHHLFDQEDLCFSEDALSRSHLHFFFVLLWPAASHRIEQ